MMFFGGEFTVTKASILDGSSPVISRWAPTRGLEAIVNWRNLVLGFTVLFLARTAASLYFINMIGHDAKFIARQRRSVLVNGAVFVVFFLTFVALLLTAKGVEVKDGVMTWVDHKYLDNLLSQPWIALVLLLGVAGVLWGIIHTIISKNYSRGIWWTGAGTVFTVMALFFLAGFSNTAYYPSTIDVNSSLTLANSSSSEFTLKVMSVVSLITPFVIAYIAYVWHSMDRKQITPEEMRSDSHKY